MPSLFAAMTRRTMSDLESTDYQISGILYEQKADAILMFMRRAGRVLGHSLSNPPRPPGPPPSKKPRASIHDTTLVEGLNMQSLADEGDLVLLQYMCQSNFSQDEIPRKQTAFMLTHLAMFTVVPNIEILGSNYNIQASFCSS